MSSYEKLFFLSISVIFALIFRNGIFFWDNIAQLSVPANYYFEHGLSHYFIPDAVATGHPTFSAYYLAIGWKIFGRSLLVSHLLFAPFIFGIILQLYNFLARFLTEKIYISAVLFLILTDATMISQMSLITFEVLHIFFFLWALNSFLNSRKIALAVAFTALCLVSLRGTMSGIGLVIFALLHQILIVRKFSLKNFLPFVPGALLFGLFLLTFYLEKHWIIHNTVSNNWQQSAERATAKDMLRNMVIIIKYIGDFGRLFLLIGTVMMFYFMAKMKKIPKEYLTILFLILGQAAIFGLILITSRNFISNRYLLPITIPLGVLFFVWIIRENKYRNLILTLCGISTFGGWFLDYPDKIATAWDCTPTHWKYFEMRRQMLSYLTEKQIPAEEVGTFFPNVAAFKMVDLANNDAHFENADLAHSKYVLFSNIYNVEDEVQDQLLKSKRHILVKKIQRGNVFLSLYQLKSQQYIPKKAYL